MTIIMITCCGCSWEDEADVASYNVSKEADNFNVYRKIVIINCMSDEILLEFEGWCSINVDETENQLELTYRIGDNAYAKDFVGLNDRTTYVITQIDGSEVSKYHYEWVCHSKGNFIPMPSISVSGGIFKTELPATDVAAIAERLI